MKNLSPWWVLVAIAGAAYWFLGRGAGAKQVSPVEIDALKSNVSQGLTVNDEVGLFDRLFGIRDASAELVKLKNSLPVNNRIRICHSDGTCEVQSRSIQGSEGWHPLKAPRYFLDYLGLRF